MHDETLIHHEWIPGARDPGRLARGAALGVVRRPFWILLVVVCIGYVGLSAALGMYDAPHLAVLLAPALFPLSVYLLTWLNLRRSLHPGSRWTSTFGPDSLTMASPAGQSTLNYSQITDIRQRGPYVSVSTRGISRIAYVAELFPPPAIDFVRGRLGCS